MGEHLTVSLPDLQQASTRLRVVATQFRTAWTTFSARVDSYGDIFGNDDLGKLIGLSYQAAHALADNTCVSAANALIDFSNGLTEMVDQYQTVEDDNRAKLAVVEA